MPEALAEGRIRSLLSTRVVGRGLEHIQTGIDEVKQGVSGTKVVIIA